MYVIQECICNWSDYFVKENRFEFGYILVEILQIYTMNCNDEQ